MLGHGLVPTHEAIHVYHQVAWGSWKLTFLFVDLSSKLNLREEGGNIPTPHPLVPGSPTPPTLLPPVSMLKLRLGN